MPITLSTSVLLSPEPYDLTISDAMIIDACPPYFDLHQPFYNTVALYHLSPGMSMIKNIFSILNFIKFCY